ncbi:MAG TPA: hypothetical protein VFH73_06750 [Polyangia bacterium]|jgi:hypothetical protein|nr:hypothetical protein [Polyangia bacterium]
MNTPSPSTAGLYFLLLAAGVTAACSSSGPGSGGVDAGRTGSGGSGSGGSAPSGVAGSGGGSGGSGGGAAGGGGTVVDGGTGGTGGTAGVGTGGSGGLDAGGTIDGTPAGDGAGLPRFSFFVTSLEAMRRLSKNDMGFGGDLKYGQADGLAGADKICTEIAEASLPGSGAKQWRAFLSVTRGPAGTPVNAADRIGNGPWYDRRARLLAMTKADVLQNRPNGADPLIKEDLPNEFGIPNHRPDPAMPVADNHHTLTGSNAQGQLYGAKATCLDWTSNARDNVATGRPRIGFSWSIANRTNWISGQDEGGCGAGVAVEQNDGSDPSNPIVGSGGGYGGIYCFALAP